MDPRNRKPTHLCQRFPRTGGDGPYHPEQLASKGALPPHGRGWTVDWNAMTEILQASPARAGMDLTSLKGDNDLLCFPRTGGDGPVRVAHGAKGIPLPPHGRGWTASTELHLRVVKASPARAGMDPREVRDIPLGGGFPRTGGDGPVVGHVCYLGTWLPPHGRGWTGGREAERAGGSASPARAGMDRSSFCRRTNALRFPRTGGDGPRCETS